MLTQVRRAGARAALTALGLALILLACASMLTGAGRIGPGQVVAYLLGESADAHLEMVVTTLRLPRTAAAVVVGAALGISGMLLQTVTRNPLAETGLLGVNSGAALGVVLGITLAGAQTGGAYLGWALGGALATSAVVLLIARGASPLRLVLAGAALSATLGGLTSAILMSDTTTYDLYRFWVLGSLAGVPPERLAAVAPAFAAGLAVAIAAVRPLAALSLGDDVARAIGSRPALTRIAVTAAVTLLSAAAVAVAGPIGFLGLLSGFFARAVAGTSVGARLAASGLIGAVVLLAADVLARVVIRPYEAPVSLLVALVGGPVLIVVARSRAVAAGAGDRLVRRAAGRRPRALPWRLPVRPPWPRADRPWVLRAGPVSLRVRVRPAVAAALLAVLAGAAVLAGVAAGQAGATVAEAARALVGLGDPATTMLVHEFRLPRVAAGFVAGAALGLSGCLTQTLARNRLATPDLLGVNQGAVVAILVAGLVSAAPTMFAHWWIGPLGSAVAALVVLAIAGGTGTQGYRIIVTGLAVTAIAAALTETVLAWRGLTAATAVYVWSIGSLNGRGYGVALPVAIGLAILLPATVAACRRLGLMRFGDEVVTALGVNAARARLATLATAVALAGLAVGVGGPIAFVALAAPVIAGRLAGPAAVPLLGSAFTGAALVVAADTLGRVVVSGAEIPVGVVTSVLGGPFLLWTLLTDRNG